MDGSIIDEHWCYVTVTGAMRYACGALQQQMHVKTISMDHKLKKWLKWMDIIKIEVQDLVMAKRTFHEVQQLIKDNPDLHKQNSFYDYLSRTYVSHVVIGLRRQIKCDETSISLARMLNELIESPQTLTREYYVALYHGSVVEDFADKDFDKFSAPGLRYIDASLVTTDLARLRDASRRCEDFADKRIAHRDKRNPKELPTFKELDVCIDILDKLYVRYFMLFYAKSMNSLLPERQYDWKSIFRVPWINKDKK